MCIECDDQDDCVYEPDEHHPSAWDDDQPEDSIGRNYNPYAGSVTPTDGRCNELLTRWEDRYDEKRYCMKTVFHGKTFCNVHKSRKNTKMRAKELMETGVRTRTLAHLFDKLSPFKQAVSLATLDSLICDSKYDFAYNIQEYTIDFSTVDGPLPPDIAEMVDQDGCVDVDVPVPTQQRHRFMALWQAALDTVKKINVNEKIFEDGPLVESTVATADSDGKITDKATDSEEHPLHLTYSRLVKDHKEHLQYGGVELDTDDEVSVDISDAQEVIMDLDDVKPNAVSDNTEEMPLMDEDLMDEAASDFAKDMESTDD